MMSESTREWISSLTLKAKQYSIIFLQLGHAAEKLRDPLLELPGLHLSVHDFLVAKAFEEIPDIIFLHELEKIRENRGNQLGTLRERIMREATSGTVFALVSTVPKTAYPEAVGSDVIVDAKQVFVPFAEIDSSHGSNSFEYYYACIGELGDRTVIALSEALWESQLSPNESLDTLPRADLEALRGAGLASIEDARARLSCGESFKIFRQAVGLVSSEYATAKEWVPDTFVELWILERILRNCIRKAIIDKMGNGWRETCISEKLRSEIIERAQKDSHPRANKITDLRDPLEWLTTTELLDLRETHELGGLGIEPFMWTKLRTEIVPIRNKVAHMRMVSELDSRRAAQWRKLVSQRLRN